MSISDSSIFSPIGIAFDCLGNLWVLDAGNNRVLMYKADRRKPDLFSSVF
ncbi:MAG TPA: hypothetical protein VLA74_14035 [Nitrososphaeraceae archaeon]|nr:hypothetical protein [Nitrososphaeraceae archaeon]